MRLDKKLALFLVVGALFAVGMACARDTVTPSGQTSGTIEPPKKILSQFSQVPGTQTLVAAIFEGETRSELDFSLSSGREYADNINNYVFFDLESEQFITLFPTNEYVILNKIGLPFSETSSSPLKWWLYYVVKVDGNQDKQLSGQDQFTLAMSEVGGQNYTELIPAVDEALGQFMKSETVLLFFYRLGEKKYYAKIDLTSRSLLATTEYPSFGVDVK